MAICYDPNPLHVADGGPPPARLFDLGIVACSVESLDVYGGHNFGGTLSVGGVVVTFSGRITPQEINQAIRSRDSEAFKRLIEIKVAAAADHRRAELVGSF